MIVPLSIPALAVVAVLGFMSVWNSFLWPLIMINSPDKFTLPVGLWQYIDQAYSEHWGPFAGGVLIAAIPAALLFAFLQRYIVQGLTQGAVKG